MPTALARSRQKSIPHETQQFQLQLAIRRCLDNSGYPQLRSITCRCHEGTAVLNGKVSSFYMKQIAQTIAYKIEGVEQVINRLNVIARREPKRLA